MPHFLEDRISTELGLLLHHDFVHSPPFVYLVKYYIGMGSDVYFTLCIIIQSYFLYFVVQLWPLGVLSRGSLDL